MIEFKKTIILPLMFLCIFIFVIVLIPNSVQADDENVNDITGNIEFNDNSSEENEASLYERYSEDYKKWLALTDEEKANYGVIPHKYDVTIDEYNTTKEIINQRTPTILKTAQNMASANLSSSFDLRNKINIRVENQGGYGICWAFASMGAVRTHASLRGISNGSDGYTVNLSEWHVNVLASRLYPSKNYNRYTGEGGNFGDAEKYFRFNDGPVLESRYQFQAYIPTDSSGLKNLDGMKPDIYVHQTIDFPSVDKRKVSDLTLGDKTKMYIGSKEITKAQMTEIRNQIKTHIMTYGGVYCSLHWRSEDASYHPKGDQYIYDDGNVPETSGHAMLIVGWNDNFNRDYFADPQGRKPNENGAYLVLNSWGTDWGNSGYCWVSYEDAKIEADLHGIIKADKTGEKVKYTLKSKKAYDKLKKTFQDEGAEMVTNDSAKTIEVYDIAINSISYLELTDCDITDEDMNEIFKKTFPKLKYLYLNYNKITTVSPILKNTNIVYLGLDSATEKQLDVSGINQLVNLEKLNLNSNGSLKNLTQVFQLKKLNELKLYNDGISSILGIKNLNNLETLHLGNNNLVDVSEIGNLSKLKNLELHYNKIEDVSKLKLNQYTIITLNNQEINKVISNTTTSYTYPNIISTYKSKGLEFTGCQQNSAGTGITITSGTGTIKVKIKSGPANGTLLTLKYLQKLIKPETAANTYKEGTTITIKAEYNTHIYATASKGAITTSNAPKLYIKFGNGAEKVTTSYGVKSDSATGNTTLLYTYKIASGDNGELTISKYSGTVYGMDGKSYSVAKLENTGNKIIADTANPYLKTIWLEPDGDTKEVYILGDEIWIRAVFNEELYSTATKIKLIKSTAPKLRIKCGGGEEKTLTCVKLSANELTYKYKLVEGDSKQLEVLGFSGNTVYDAVGHALTTKNMDPSKASIKGIIKVDTTYPNLKHVTVTSPAEGTYTVGQVITINTEFHENVYGGKKLAAVKNNPPVLNVRFSGNRKVEKKATFSSASGKIITYKYTVAKGDSGYLEFANMTGTVYDKCDNSGKIEDTKGIDKLTIEGNKIGVDTAGPQITKIAVSRYDAKNKKNIIKDYTVCQAKDLIKVDVTYDEAIYANNKKETFTTANTPASAPILAMKLGTVAKNVKASKVNGKVISYEYEVQAGDTGLFTISNFKNNIYDVLGNTTDTSRLTIKDKITGAEIGVDTKSPTVQSIKVTNPKDAKTCKVGEKVTIYVQYNEVPYQTDKKVKFTANNAPILTLKTDKGVDGRKATFVGYVQYSSSDKRERILKYEYTITAGDKGVLSISKYANKSGTKVYDQFGNGGEVKTVELGGAKVTVEEEKAPPVLQSINVTSPKTGTYKAGTLVTIVSTFNEKLYTTASKGTLTKANAPKLYVKIENTEKQATCTAVADKTITYQYKIIENDKGKITLSKCVGSLFNEYGKELKLTGKALILGGNVITADTTVPTCTITADKTSPTNASSIKYTFTFSENVTGFTKDDVTVENGVKGAFAGSGNVYTLVVTNSGSCEQKVSVAAGKCIDVAGNNNKVSNSLKITIDRTAPTCTITADETSPTSDDSIKYTFTFSEDVTGFTKEDITVENGTAGTFAGSGKVYTLVVTNNESCTQKVYVDAGKCTDTVGNNNKKSNVFTMLIDKTVLTCKITANEQSPTYADSVIYTFTFSKEVTGFTKEDITVENGTKGEFTGSGKVYTLVVTNTEDCIQKVSIAEGVCETEAGNLNKKAEKTIVIDKTGPTVEVTAEPSGTTNASSVTYTFTFSEEVIDFTKEDIKIENGTSGKLQGLGKVYTLVVNNIGSCTQKVSVGAGVCTDIAGNENEESNICEVIIKKDSSSEKVEVLLGDINENGTIDISDLIAISRHIATEGNGKAMRSWKLNDRKKLIADATKDGKINISDVVKLKRYIAAIGDEKVENKNPKWKELDKITLDKIK